ncbi:hypothetical protein ACFLTS_01680 [Chloroflexota bacterium]
MSDWGQTLEIVGWGVLYIAVVLSIVTLAMWTVGKIFRMVGSNTGKKDKGGS